jgi:prolipoprotein diacylglyceryltransferase
VTFGFFGAVGRFSVELLRPPAGATSGRIRKSGALGMLVGAALVVVAIAVEFALARAGTDVSKSGRISLTLVFPGLAFMIVGSFRVIAGREPDDASSFRRIALGVAGAVFSLVLLMVLLVGGAVLYEAIAKM